MPDPRFFEDLGPVQLGELAELAGAKLSRPDDASRAIQAVAIVSQARPGSVTFLTDSRHAAGLADTQAAACFVSAALAEAVPEGCAAVITATPQGAYAIAARRLHRLRTMGPGPAVSPEAELEEGVVLAPGVVVGAGARIGRGTMIGANTVIGPGVTIGRDGVISAQVAIQCALIGDRVQILAGAVIGEPGFGATVGPQGLIDIPQLGRAIVQDGVTIGAGTCVDRGAFDDTAIGENTKIDNMVQIAHNVRIGRNCVIAAHTGISGSVTVGDGAQMGGRVGIADHLNIGAGARLAAAAGVMKDIPAGETWGGFPARPMRTWLRESAWLSRQSLPRKE